MIFSNKRLVFLFLILLAYDSAIIFFLLPFNNEEEKKSVLAFALTISLDKEGCLYLCAHFSRISIAHHKLWDFCRFVFVVVVMLFTIQFRSQISTNNERFNESHKLLSGHKTKCTNKSKLVTVKIVCVCVYVRLWLIRLRNDGCPFLPDDRMRER